MRLVVVGAQESGFVAVQEKKITCWLKEEDVAQGVAVQIK
jgi:hypothetical protein